MKHQKTKHVSHQLLRYRDIDQQQSIVRCQLTCAADTGRSVGCWQVILHGTSG
jgi:hypothetical protein